MEAEAAAIGEMFARYSTGTDTLATLAGWLNGQGFRTRNTKSLPGDSGLSSAGPRLFTAASVRGILHNPFYAGMVRHGKVLHPGAHSALVSRELFQEVQSAMRRNSGRSETLAPHPLREYLLKGLVRCAYCRLPMWAQTYKSGRRYYREHRASRSGVECPSGGGSILCGLLDAQVGRIVQAIALPQAWMDRLLARLHMEDEVERVERERGKLRERLRRLGKAFVDGVYGDEDYRREKERIEERLSGLVVPGVDAASEAGRLLERMPELWDGATLSERRSLLLLMLEGVYVDTKVQQKVVAIRPRPAFRALLDMALCGDGSGPLLPIEHPETPAMGVLPPHEQGAPGALRPRAPASRVSGGDGGESNSPRNTRFSTSVAPG